MSSVVAGSESIFNEIIRSIGDIVRISQNEFKSSLIVSVLFFTGLGVKRLFLTKNNLSKSVK